MSKLLDDLDTLNKFGVCTRGDAVAFLRQVPAAITKAEALVLAAWLVSIADDHDDFGAIIQRVQAP